MAQWINRLITTITTYRIQCDLCGRSEHSFWFSETQAQAHAARLRWSTIGKTHICPACVDRIKKAKQLEEERKRNHACVCLVHVICPLHTPQETQERRTAGGASV